jgi:hypothetical protein
LVRFSYGINAAAFLPSISYSAEIFDGCPLFTNCDHAVDGDCRKRRTINYTLLLLTALCRPKDR